MQTPLALHATEVGYMAIVSLGAWLAYTRRLRWSHVLLVTAFCMSMLSNAAQDLFGEFGWRDNGVVNNL